MASDTDTKKTKASAHKRPRWFRLAAPTRPDLPEFGPLLDLYWGGPERRITGITLRIIGVNALALLILMFGILYLGQYQNSVINARLETFQAELEVISAALSESVLEQKDTLKINQKTAEYMVARLALTTRQRIQIFNTSGMQLVDSRKITGLDDRLWAQQDRKKIELQSVQTLINMTRFVLNLLPDHRKLPLYPQAQNQNITPLPDITNALNKQTSLSAWENENEHIVLSGAAPLTLNNKLAGGVLLTRESTKIQEDISAVWTNVLKVFLITLVVTILLSIYLSGTIARPLKKLAKAAEAVRRGNATADDIPDFSHRYDEIGELSVVLRQMTEALWERMDSIESFAADVAHELKNPLTSLRSAIETVSIVKKKEDSEKLMNIINHDVERLDRLITDISNASRIESELSREAFKKVSLRNLLSNLIESHAADPLARAPLTNGDWSKTVVTQNTTLGLSSTSARDMYVWGVESRLAQVFENILSNALSFSPKDETISIRVSTSGDQVRITIEDHGAGIPENKINTIFERFYSERPEHENYGQHSGLGLSICKQIIEAHGGQIFAENNSNHDGKIVGARFTVLLNTL